MKFAAKIDIVKIPFTKEEFCDPTSPEVFFEIWGQPPMWHFAFSTYLDGKKSIYQKSGINMKI